MITRINHTEEILNSLESVPVEWTPEQWDDWHEQMENLHQEYLRKSAGSEISARLLGMVNLKFIYNK